MKPAAQGLDMPLEAPLAGAGGRKDFPRDIVPIGRREGNESEVQAMTLFAAWGDSFPGLGRSLAGHGLDIITCIDEEERLACFRLRHRVFCRESGLFQSPPCVDLEVDQHDSHSVLFLAGRGREAVGSLRLVLPPGSTAMDMCSLPADLISGISIAEAGRFCVAREWRRMAHLLLAGMGVAAYEESRRRGITHWIFEGNRSVSDLLDSLGVPYRTLDSLAPSPENLSARARYEKYYNTRPRVMLIDLEPAARALARSTEGADAI